MKKFLFSLVFALYLKSYTFWLNFILYLHVWIRIRNTDPAPQSSWIRIQYGSGTGSTTLVARMGSSSASNSLSDNIDWLFGSVFPFLGFYGITLSRFSFRLLAVNVMARKMASAHLFGSINCNWLGSMSLYCRLLWRNL